jgi:hypothetical protein
MRAEGLEPPWAFAHQDLNLARLTRISPRPLPSDSMGRYVRPLSNNTNVCLDPSTPVRPRAEFDSVLALVQEGLNDCEIARRTGIPRRTVSDWRRGRTRARDFGSGCPVHGHTPLPIRDYAYLLGMYLGDGCLTPGANGRSWRLRIFADLRYVSIIEECSNAMEAVFPMKQTHWQRRGTSGCVELSMWSKHWPCIFPQHGPGKKHLRQIALLPWQQEIVDAAPGVFLRGLIHSDGCRIIAVERRRDYVRRAPRYVFSNMSSEIRKLFCDTCDALGILWTTPSHNTVAIYRLESVRRMDEFVGPKS